MDLVSARRRQLQASRVNDTDYFSFSGGLNLIGTPLELKPGQLLACSNYEPVAGPNGGYTSLAGFERFDGRVEPSQASYWMLDYDQAAVQPAIGSTVTGATSGATGILLTAAIAHPVTHVNRFLRAPEFTHATWTKVTIAVTTDAQSNPLGTQTYKVTEALEVAPAAAVKNLRQLVTKAAVAESWRATWWVKSNGRNVRVHMGDASATDSAFANFDLVSGLFLGTSQSGAFTPTDTAIEPIAGFPGWYRVSMTVTTDAETGILARIYCMSGSTTSYTGDGVSGLFVAGAMLERLPTSTDLSVFVPTVDEVRGNGVGAYVFGRLTGTFQDNEDLDVSGATQAVADGITTENDAPTDEAHVQYKQAATDDARAQITAVPGSGAVLGTAVYKGVGYAVRNNAGGTAAVLHKSTPTGWQAVSLGFKVRFTVGLVAAITEGATVTGATSGATGVVRRVVVQTGTFAGGDGAGYLVIMSITGTFQNAEKLQIGGTDRATVSGTQTAQVLLPNGRFEFRVTNFYGHSSTVRLYGVDGVNRGFEYQDSPAFFCQIETGMTADAPNHIGVHNEQLFYSFQGGSVQKSGVGDPVIWQVSLGAGEIAIGDECTGFLEELGGTLFIFALSKTLYLTGKEGTYLLDKFNNDVGARPGTMQRIGQGVYLDDRGFALLAASQNFGNFSYNSFSALIKPLIEQIKLTGTASVVARDKNLYRCFFADGRFVSIGFNGRKVVGITTSSYSKVVRCAFSGEDSAGAEMLLFGSDDGFVYRADRGTSFDGAEIQSFLRPVFHHSRSPSRRKRYRRAQFDVAVQGPCAIQIGVDYSFADPDEPGEPISTIEMEGGGGLWNVSDWNEFKWNTGVGSSAICKLEGSGINIGFIIACSSAVDAPHTLQGVTLHHSQRRLNRGISNA